MYNIFEKNQYDLYFCNKKLFVPFYVLFCNEKSFFYTFWLYTFNGGIEPELIKRFYALFELTEIASFKDGLEHLITDLKGFNITKCNALSTTLNSWFKEIVNIIEYGYNNGFVEGFNNKIKVIKRIGYGYRNYERFNKLMKIRLQA